VPITNLSMAKFIAKDRLLRVSETNHGGSSSQASKFKLYFRERDLNIGLFLYHKYNIIFSLLSVF
jgi:hypothetical protein